MIVRSLRVEDAHALLHLTEVAGWNQTLADWERVLRLSAGESWGVEHEGQWIASTTAVHYPGGAAWIGMVLTHPDWRGRGIARTLMQHALDQLDATGAGCQKLDATDMGRPLYKSLGFEELFAVERWEGVAEAFPREELAPFQLAGWAEFDRAVFREDRSALLEDLAAGESAALLPDGFAFARAGRHARFFGPCVATNEDTARRLARSLLGAHPKEKFFWDLIPGHTAAANLARDLGFRPSRRLVRMRRGCGAFNEPWPQKRIFALAGFEFG